MAIGVRGVSLPRHSLSPLLTSSKPLISSSCCMVIGSRIVQPDRTFDDAEFNSMCPGARPSDRALHDPTSLMLRRPCNFTLKSSWLALMTGMQNQKCESIPIAKESYCDVSSVPCVGIPGGKCVESSLVASH